MPWTGFAGALTGGLLSAASGIGGSLMQAHQASVANKEAYYYTKKLNEQADARAFNNSRALFDFQQRNAVPLQYGAMKKAGINPLLALGGVSGGSMPSFNAHAGSVNARDTSAYSGIGRAVSDAVAQFLNYQSVASQSELNSANAKKALMAADDNRRLTDTRVMLDNLDAVVKEGLPKKLQEEVNLLKSQIVLSNAQRQYYESSAATNAAKVEDISSQISLRDWEKDFRERTKNSYGLPFGILHRTYSDTEGGPMSDVFNPMVRGFMDFVDFNRAVSDINRSVRNLKRMQQNKK